MKRIAIAFIFAPLLVSIIFGWPGMVLVAPFAAIMALVAGGPLFFLFLKFGWLKWWQVAFAGLFCGFLFVVILDSSERLDMFGIKDALFFGGVGILISLVFWWLGLFRNNDYPVVSSSFPYSMLVLIPLFALGVLTSRSLDTNFSEGRVIAVKGDPPSRVLTIRLRNGLVVKSTLQDSRPTEGLTGQCWHLLNHWSTWRFERVYTLMSPFGGAVNEC
jgi:hypothetical protein